MGPRNGWSGHALGWPRQYFGATLKVACTLTQGKSSEWPAQDDLREMDTQDRRERWPDHNSLRSYPIVNAIPILSTERHQAQEGAGGDTGRKQRRLYLKPSDYFQSPAPSTACCMAPGQQGLNPGGSQACRPGTCTLGGPAWALFAEGTGSSHRRPP